MKKLNNSNILLLLLLFLINITKGKKHAIKGGWRNLRNEELNDSCFSPHVIRGYQLKKLVWRGMRHVWVKEKYIQGFGGDT
jgi:hypothetical protein